MAHSLASNHNNYFLTIKPRAELRDKNILATIAVKDLAVARKFYEEKLGLPLLEIDSGHYATYKTRSSRLLVYQSTFLNGNNMATVVTFEVGDDIEEIVETLHNNGLVFEQYNDMPDCQVKNDIYKMGTMKKAWLKDPDGNIICLSNSMCSLYFA